MTLLTLKGLSLSVDETTTKSVKNDRIVQYTWAVKFGNSSLPADHIQLDYKLAMGHGEIEDFDNTSKLTDIHGETFQNLTYDKVSSFSYNLTAKIADCQYPELRYENRT